MNRPVTPERPFTRVSTISSLQRDRRRSNSRRSRSRATIACLSARRFRFRMDRCGHPPCRDVHKPRWRRLCIPVRQQPVQEFGTMWVGDPTGVAPAPWSRRGHMPSTCWRGRAFALYGRAQSEVRAASGTASSSKGRHSERRSGTPQRRVEAREPGEGVFLA
jgi:hypothetical protein